MGGVVIVDAGHGGDGRAGASSANRVVGPAGSREKDLTLDLARRVRAELRARGQHVVLTRDADDNVTLRDRALASSAHAARAFVSLHFNGSARSPDREDPPRSQQGCEIWVHDHSGPSSLRLAGALQRQIVGVTGHPALGIRRGPMAVLDPRYQGAATAACLAEVSYLSDPAEEERLRDAGYRQRIARAIATAIGEATDGAAVDGEAGDGLRALHVVHDEFDIWHEVPLVQQLTGMSCWAAAAAMLVGWRDCIDIDPEEVARGTGRWEAYRDGLEQEDVKALAAAWGLVTEPPRAYTVASLRKLLEDNGPLWVGEASPGLHVITIAGMYGNGTPGGTFVRIADPWPVGLGERYTISFSEMKQRLEAAAGICGVAAQVLHTGGRRGGTRRVVSRHGEVHAELDATDPPIW